MPVGSLTNGSMKVVMASTDLNVIVCTDERRCMYVESKGRNGPAILEGLKESVKEAGLEDKVQVTPCSCIFGCTYGPRIDVARRWSGEKVLYGVVEGEVFISVRGRVRMTRIPDELPDLIRDNLP